MEILVRLQAQSAWSFYRCSDCIDSSFIANTHGGTHLWGHMLLARCLDSMDVHSHFCLTTQLCYFHMRNLFAFSERVQTSGFAKSLAHFGRSLLRSASALVSVACGMTKRGQAKFITHHFEAQCLMTSVAVQTSTNIHLCLQGLSRAFTSPAKLNYILQPQRLYKHKPPALRVRIFWHLLGESFSIHHPMNVTLAYKSILVVCRIIRLTLSKNYWNTATKQDTDYVAVRRLRRRQAI